MEFCAFHSTGNDMNAADFLSTADDLITLASREADFRSAVSRAYYACHWILRESVFPQLLPQAKTKSKISSERDLGHRDLILCLKSALDGNVRALGGDLASLYENRETADYDSVVNYLQAVCASDAVANAHELLNALSALLPTDIGNVANTFYEKTWPLMRRR